MKCKNAKCFEGRFALGRYLNRQVTRASIRRTAHGGSVGSLLSHPKPPPTQPSTLSLSLTDQACITNARYINTCSYIICCRPDLSVCLRRSLIPGLPFNDSFSFTDMPPSHRFSSASQVGAIALARAAPGPGLTTQEGNSLGSQCRLGQSREAVGGELNRSGCRVSWRQSTAGGITVGADTFGCRTSLDLPTTSTVDPKSRGKRH